MTTETQQVITNDDTNTVSSDPSSIQDWHDRWINRRRMAWFSLFTITGVTLLMYFVVPVDKIDKLADVTIWLYGVLASVILGYMGTTVSAHIFDRRK